MESNTLTTCIIYSLKDESMEGIGIKGSKSIEVQSLFNELVQQWK